MKREESPSKHAWKRRRERRWGRGGGGGGGLTLHVDNFWRHWLKKTFEGVVYEVLKFH